MKILQEGTIAIVIEASDGTTYSITEPTPSYIRIVEVSDRPRTIHVIPSSSNCIVLKGLAGVFY